MRCRGGGTHHGQPASRMMTRRMPSKMRSERGHSVLQSCQMRSRVSSQTPPSILPPPQLILLRLLIRQHSNGSSETAQHEGWTKQRGLCACGLTSLTQCTILADFTTRWRIASSCFHKPLRICQGVCVRRVVIFLQSLRGSLRCIVHDFSLSLQQKATRLKSTSVERSYPPHFNRNTEPKSPLASAKATKQAHKSNRLICQF